MTFKITIDTGGTFTDVVVADVSGRLHHAKAPTSYERAYEGAREALGLLAVELQTDLPGLLSNTGLLVYATTRATNAIIERKTAKTAFLTTEGFPDILVMREGGKSRPFDHTVPYPDPYVPRALTFEIRERIGPRGEEVIALDTDQVRETLERARHLGAEALAVCLLWSIANPCHELKIEDIILQAWPAVPYTLSHRLNPIIREYRRASSTALDASLKPLMQSHLRQTCEDLIRDGFGGELLVVTSLGGCLRLDDVLERPLYVVASGPAMAPVAGQQYALHDSLGQDVIVCDAGGTSFDVSLIESGGIRTARETWLGPQFQGEITGLPAIDVKSIGAGGGSIAWVDAGGLLHVGPDSAGAVPGPACYGRGGTKPTVTDAALILGYLDPEFFLGGRLALDGRGAEEALRDGVAVPLGLSLERAAYAVVKVAIESMVASIKAITIGQGVDPRGCVLLAGGGAGGLTAVAIARELGCRSVFVPATAATLSAGGAQFADIVMDFSEFFLTSTGDFDIAGVNDVLERLAAHVGQFADRLMQFPEVVESVDRSFVVEARYPYQVWELEVALPQSPLAREDVDIIGNRFHEAHRKNFRVAEPNQLVECQRWRARATARVKKPQLRDRQSTALNLEPSPHTVRERMVYFANDSPVAAKVYRASDLRAGDRICGPAVVEETFTTVVVPPEATASISASGSLLVDVEANLPWSAVGV